MEKYLEQILHLPINIQPFENTEQLPLVCRNAFELKMVEINGFYFLLAAPYDDMNLSELRKMRIQLERNTGYPCAFCLKKINWYAAPKMIEEGIPFIWENHQVYLPFCGIMLNNSLQRTPKNCAVISFLTQKLLIKALYERWENVSAAMAARMLGVTRMSITRCYDEIEVLGMPFLKVQNRSRRFSAFENRKEMWEIILPFMRNPIIRTFKVQKKPDAQMMLSGISALAVYSLIEEDDCVTYAIQKEQVRTLKIKELKETPLNESPAFIIHEVGYFLSFDNNKAVDPLTLALILKNEEKTDPRVEKCVREMLEEFVWLKE